MARLTPLAVGSPLAVSAPLIGSSVPILMVFSPPPPPPPDALGVLEHAENAIRATAPSAPTLTNFIQTPPRILVAGYPVDVGRRLCTPIRLAFTAQVRRPMHRCAR